MVCSQWWRHKPLYFAIHHGVSERWCHKQLRYSVIHHGVSGRQRHIFTMVFQEGDTLYSPWCFRKVTLYIHLGVSEKWPCIFTIVFQEGDAINRCGILYIHHGVSGRWCHEPLWYCIYSPWCFRKVAPYIHVFSMVFKEGDTMNHLVFNVFTMVFQEGGPAGEGGSVAGRVGNPAGPSDLTGAQGRCCLVVLAFCAAGVSGVGWLVLWMIGFIVVHCRTLWATGFSAGMGHVYRRRK